ncbi:hypothetical protein [Sideroxydans lithotrophicus]|uniref:Uncharacterized protein n=1 Tax=Sideroxydans lithotrophicus (strain ES-1) TaxID=580332 RepID=D5CUC5_SIDLE|nr:hypothetical protein [Sideroxydans lithotrophicus]ADE10460.1 hypothetical protein Slit_0218 [Sideroxydans lithotrophicus ES-1]
MQLNPIPWQGRALALLLLVIACIAFGVVAGLKYESNRRDALELKQKRVDDKLFLEAVALGHQAAANAIEWKRRARIYYRNWQERLNHEQDSNLAQCQQAGDVLLSGTFVGMYNAAWRIESDQGDSAGAAAEVVAAGSVTPRHVLENVRENADLCGEDRKRHDELVDLLIGMGAGK